MNKRYEKISRILPLTAVVSGIFMLALGIAALNMDIDTISTALLAAGGIIVVTVAVLMINKHRIRDKFLEAVGENAGNITSNILSAFPMPMVVVNVDGTVRWYNKNFEELFDGKKLIGGQFTSLFSNIKWSEILKNTQLINKSVTVAAKKYELIGRMVKEPSEDKDVFSVYLYLLDKSEYHEILEMYKNEKTDVAFICIDNYDEVMQRIEDNLEEEIMSQIRKKLNQWAKDGDAIIKRLGEDRYLLLFEHEKLNYYIEDKFSVVKNVRKLGEDYNAAISISIGVGSGENLTENEKFARSALEMTQGRGGDQVCIKTRDSFRFYGGKNKEYEKNNRVKTRFVAGALKEFLLNADYVFLMGHSNADYDCLGAAMGLQRAAREFGAIPYVVVDNNSPAVKPMMDILNKSDEYKGLFVTNETAIERITEKSVLIILDTHRPQMLPCPQLTQFTNKIVVIDHHRRSMDFINPCALVYHELYASSTCEMVTELIDYMDVSAKLTRSEVECLYTGILMDTKNFLVKTGVRTFEAASVLRRLGLDTLDVKKLFNVAKNDYDRKVDIVKTAEEIYPKISLAFASRTYPNIRVIASQAADEMLNIGENKASIVIFPIDGMYGICARSISDINVQLIMEELGGGGHATVAGAQVQAEDIEKLKQRVKIAVTNYMRNN